MLRKRSVLAAKVESVVGTAETLAAADAGWNAFNAQMTLEGDYVEREGQGAFSRIGGVVGGRRGTIKFSMHLHGSGTPGAPVPAWADAFLPACGLVKATNVFAPLTGMPGTSAATNRSVTIGLYEDGRLRRLGGCMGTVKLVHPAGAPVRMDFEFRGVYVAPSDVAILVPAYPTILPPRFASSAILLGGTAPRISELTLDIGNKIELRQDSTTAMGYLSAFIADRQVAGSMDPEAVTIATNDVHAAWLAGTLAALTWQVGAGSANGNTINFSVPKAQYKAVADADRNGVTVDRADFVATRNGSAGDDELSITFS